MARIVTVGAVIGRLTVLEVGPRCKCQCTCGAKVSRSIDVLKWNKGESMCRKCAQAKSKATSVQRKGPRRQWPRVSLGQ